MLKNRSFLHKGKTQPKSQPQPQPPAPPQPELNFVVKNTPTVVEHSVNMKEQAHSLFPYSVCICVTSLTHIVDVSDILDRIDTIRKMFKKSFVIYVGKHEGYTNIQNSLYVYMDNASEAQMRNAYLNVVVKNKGLFDVMMVVDPHIALLRDIPQTSLECCSTSKFESWDAVFANQSYKYYDIHSLILNSYEQKRKHAFHIPADQERIPVISAFGGLALYKTSYLDSTFKYVSDGNTGFNVHYFSSSNRMFILPSFVLETPEENAFLYC